MAYDSIKESGIDSGAKRKAGSELAKRDQKGPDHRPDLDFDAKIDGVVVAMAPVVPYEYGILTELYRPEWHGVFAEGEAIEHLYAVTNHAGMRDEWYFHEHTLDRYMVLHGVLELGLYDGREGSATHGEFTVVSLSGGAPGFPNSVRIPPGVWHSLRWTTQDGLFVNAKLPGFNRELVDKFRIPRDQLPPQIVWDVEHS